MVADHVLKLIWQKSRHAPMRVILSSLALGPPGNNGENVPCPVELEASGSAFVTWFAYLLLQNTTKSASMG